MSLLNDPVAQELLQAKLWAHLAYIWRDETPRVVPIGFYWNGREVVLATGPDAPKVRALTDGTPVALTIASVEPDRALLIRGTARLSEVEGVTPEYAAMCERMMGEEAGRVWVAQLAAIMPRMVRIAVEPTWVGVLDETRLPHFLERAMARARSEAEPVMHTG